MGCTKDQCKILNMTKGLWIEGALTPCCQWFPLQFAGTGGCPLVSRKLKHGRVPDITDNQTKLSIMHKHHVTPTWTTTTWMETWSGNLIGALKCCDRATSRCRIATMLLAWTAKREKKHRGTNWIIEHTIQADNLNLKMRHTIRRNL